MNDLMLQNQILIMEVLLENCSEYLAIRLREQIRITKDQLKMNSWIKFK
jgi:hypothetical protein